MTRRPGPQRRQPDRPQPDDLSAARRARRAELWALAVPYGLAVAVGVAAGSVWSFWPSVLAVAVTAVGATFAVQAIRRRGGPRR